METPSNTTFYGQDIVSSSNVEQIGLPSKKNLHQLEPEKLQTLEQQQQMFNTKTTNSQTLKKTNNLTLINGIETPSSQQFQSLSQNKNRGTYPMDYSNYYSTQTGYPVMQNVEFLNSSVPPANTGYTDYLTNLNLVVSPIAQTANQELSISGLKQPRQYTPPHAQYTQPVYSQQNPYLIFQQQDFYASNLGNKSRNSHQQQQQKYSARNGHQTFSSTPLQTLYQGEKIALESDENDSCSHQTQQLQLQLQQQQLQQLLNQAFANPSPMLYTQATLPQFSLSYSSPSIQLNYYQVYAAQRQYQQQQLSKPKTQVTLSARNQLISSTITNKSRNSSTFSNKEEQPGSRATSISSCIPQTEPPLNIVKPRIATRRWEEERTNCYQVRVNEILVSRREDNNYINCTKLLNVTGMSRGKRDGILKTEKVKDVVKVGTMNLKGVWIPFDRAYEIARNEGVDELLQPLFVRNIKEYFLTEGYKLKNENESEELKPRKMKGQDKSNLKIMDVSSSIYEKSTSCPTGGYATSLPSSESKEYDN